MLKKDENNITVEAYDRNAQYYADKFDSYSIRTEDVDRALRLNESGLDIVLELGCGNGRDAEYIISSVGAGAYTGIDASEGLINLARKRIPTGGFHVKDMREFDFRPDSLGVIFSFDSVLHVKREELAEIIDKCQKSLKIGGILYMATKYGEYRELEIMNLGDKKYYYPYTPNGIERMAGTSFTTVFSIIHDSDYGPELVIALRKV